MKWIWLLISITSSAVGDLTTAKGMSEHEGKDVSGTKRLEGILAHIATHKLVIFGIFFDAIAFMSLLALLSVAPVSFAVPAGAGAYILKIAFAHRYLGEHIDKRRLWGALCVALGIVLIAM